MVDETYVGTRNGEINETSHTLRGDVGGFALDVLTLTELQSKLFVMEVQECGRRSLAPTMLLLFAATLGAACFPMALVAVALVLVHAFVWSHAFAFAITAIAGTILSLLVCALGWMLLRNRLSMPNRSRQELARNLRWMKTAIQNSRTPKRATK